MTTVSDMSRQYKAKLVQISTTAINDVNVLVCYGHPGKFQPDDIVSWGRVTATITQGPLSASNRARDITLVASVKVSIKRGGGPEMEQVAADRAYYLLNAIEEYVRATDTTLGGLVWWCFCTGHDADGATAPENLAEGRIIEIDAEFTAQGRITS
jgi:hypothetical protein